MSSLIRVGVLDEQEVVHYGLRACFSDLPDIAIAGTYCRPSSALHAIEHGDIDLLIMDHGFKSRDGLDFIRNLNLIHPELPVLVFLADLCPATVRVLLEIGVHGIVCKRQSLSICVQAIRLLATGQHYLCPSLGGIHPLDLLSMQAGTQDAETSLLSHSSLSRREREVLRLCISGLTVTRIAELCSRSSKTVSTQKQAAYRKLGLKSDMDLFRTLALYGF